MRIGVRRTELHEGGTPLPAQQPQLRTAWLILQSLQLGMVANGGKEAGEPY